MSKLIKNQMDRIMERSNNVTYFDFLKYLSDKSVCVSEIESLIYKRVFNGITQESVAKGTRKSVRTIKRFESGMVDSLSIYLYYVEQFEHLSSRSKPDVPDWVFSK